MNSWRLTIPAGLFARLRSHLFPGDAEEHGAVILAGTCESDRGNRLIARELHLAKDGVDYVPGNHGHRMLKAGFILPQILRARDHKLAYLAVHCHGGSDTVSFSATDMASHERGYPALLDIAQEMPVGALVFAESAAEGDLWFPDGHRASLSHAAIIGQRRHLLFPKPQARASSIGMFDRQSRLFGDAGQELLKRTRVGIVGLGGAGSVLAELLGRLGVGEFVLADPDRAEESNLPRLIAARHRDAVVPDWLPDAIKRRMRSPKVKMAARNIRRANQNARVIALARNFLDADVAKYFKDCDFIFLAADKMGTRLLFNAITHQYGIPGIQVGAKIPVAEDGTVGNVFCVSRMVTPDQGCLWCNGLISPGKLQNEAVPNAIKQGYAYLDDADVVAPSVVTLNSIACAHAVDAFLFYMMDLKYTDAESGWFRWNSRRGTAGYDLPTKSPNCMECSKKDRSRLAMGDNAALPTRPVPR